MMKTMAEETRSSGRRAQFLARSRSMGDSAPKTGLPGLDKLLQSGRVVVTQGEGPGFAEVFFRGEPESPVPGANVIDIRKTGGKPKSKIVAGELLHFLGANPAFNPEFFDKKQEFIENMPEEELEFARKKFQQQISSGATGSNFSSFESFLKNVYSDSMIRGSIFPELMRDKKEQEAFRKRKFLSPRQAEIIDEMQQILKKPDERPSSGRQNRSGR